MTGAPLPEGADAVLMAEDAREEEGSVLVQAAVTPGKNVGRRGEDVSAGETCSRAVDAFVPRTPGFWPASVVIRYP